VGHPVVMPALGMSQDTGLVVRWLKEEGEEVRRGEPLLEIETDKAQVEVEAQASGILGGVRAREGDEVPVGRTIAFLLAPGESPPPPEDPADGAAADPADSAAAGPASAPAGRAEVRSGGPPVGPPSPQAADLSPPWEQARSAARGPGRPPRPPRPAASPKARRLAAQRGVDLAGMVGSGPGGAVLEADLEAPARGRDSAPWRAMAESTARSWQQTPHFFLFRDVDAARLLEARAQAPAGLTLTDLLGVGLARCLARHPVMNLGSGQVNLGLAVATDGVVVPVVHGAERLSPAGFAERRAAITERARAGRLRAGDLGGATFTLSNLGMYGVDAFTAVVTEGQVGILAAGRVVDRVVAVEGSPAVRPMLALGLSCDHRLVDGARAARFLSELAERLEND
jgi:pyruvate dehydrogenase E2 component (dihydrolipoamide acetyltransferase)